MSAIRILQRSEFRILLTDNGHERISSLKDKEVNVWNGTEFSQTKVVQTNVDSELIEVSFS